MYTQIPLLFLAQASEKKRFSKNTAITKEKKKKINQNPTKTKQRNSRSTSETLVARGYAWKYSKVLEEAPGKPVRFRIANQAGEFMLNYTTSFENIYVMTETDNTNSPDPVKFLFQKCI